jgi:ATP-dependent Clp protease ATP-binding subunit ClpA
MGMLEHCTEAAHEALLQAQEEALRLDHDYTDSGHIILGLLGEKTTRRPRSCAALV